MKFSREVSSPQVRADCNALLYVPVRRTVWSLQAGTVTFSITRQARPVTPTAFEDKPDRSELITHLHTHPDHAWRYPAGHDFVLESTVDIARLHRHLHSGFADRLS